jgi:hypothetical protein
MSQHTRPIDSSLRDNGAKEKSKREHPKGRKNSEDHNAGRKSSLPIEEPNQAKINSFFKYNILDTSSSVNATSSVESTAEILVTGLIQIKIFFDGVSGQ